MRVDPTTLVLAALGGAALALIHLAGLWWTLRRIAASRRPGGLLIASSLLRAVLVALAFAIAARSSWQAAAVALAGFVLTRTIAVRAVAARPAARRDPRPEENAP